MRSATLLCAAPLRAAVLLALAGWMRAAPASAQVTPERAARAPTLPPVALHESERLEVRAPHGPDSLPRMLYVSLPQGYGDSVAERFPVVYVLDGDGLFGVVSELARILALGREVPGALVVGVAYGRPYITTVPFRNRDLAPEPVSSLPRSGDAARMLAYLRREVVPLVDSMYRTLPGDRTLLGGSLGGTFGVFALYEAPDLFRRFVIASPAGQFGDGRYFLRRDSAFAATARPLPVAVYLCVGGEEMAKPLGKAWREYADVLRARTYAGLHLTTEVLAGETHFSSPGTAFTHGLKAVFRESPAAHATSGR